MQATAAMPMTDQEVREYFRARSSKGNSHTQSAHADEVLREIIAYAGSGHVSIKSGGTMAQTVNELTFDALSRLFTNQSCAIHVPNFVSPATCRVLNRWMESKSPSTKWKNTDMYYGLGLPVNIIQGSKANDCLKYFNQAISTMRRIREASKTLAPLDKLRLELDETWHPGARISTDNPYRRKMFVGLTRVMRPEGLVGQATLTEGLIHVDGPLSADATQGVFSANVYLKVPRRGGELNIWSISLAKNGASNSNSVLAALLANAFSPKYREKVQSALRRILPPPVMIKPMAGDLIVLNAGRPHAVRGFLKGLRISMQAFIAYKEGQPLQLFS